MHILTAVISTALLSGSYAGIPKASNPKPLRFIRAVVVDHRLSALRLQPDQKSRVLQRMSLGRKVFIVGSKRAPDQPLFYRVAISRRTRGWVHHAALTEPGRAGEDRRILTLIKSSDDGLDRILLCKLLKEAFPRSPLLPEILLLMGEEADRAAKTLTGRVQGRVAAGTAGALLRDLYLNDPSLDRYSRLGVRFDFHPAGEQLVYDKQAYRELVARYPATEQALRARKLLVQ